MVKRVDEDEWIRFKRYCSSRAMWVWGWNEYLESRIRGTFGTEHKKPKKKLSGEKL